jgi:hypothetical protein
MNLHDRMLGRPGTLLPAEKSGFWRTAVSRSMHLVRCLHPVRDVEILPLLRE